MIINHPLLGPRDSSEFVYLGDANLINRPNWQEDSALEQFVDYGYLAIILPVCIVSYGSTNTVIDPG